MSQHETSSHEGGPVAWIAGIALLLALAGFQISPLAAWGPVRADGLLVLAMAWAALTGSSRGLVFGMASGAVEDALIGGGLTFTVLRGLLGWGMGRLRPVLNVRQPAISVPLVALATVLQEAALGLAHHDWSHFEQIWLPAVLANSLIAWPLYRFAAVLWRPGRGPVPPRRSSSRVAGS